MLTFTKASILSAGLFAATALASPASAQQCAQAPVIVQLADSILAERQGLTGFVTQRFGTEALYLKLRYEPPAPRHGVTMISALMSEGRRPPRNLKDLRSAYTLAKFGAIWGLEVGTAALVNMRDSGLRALVLADGGARFFEVLNAARQSPDAPATLGPRFLPFNVARVIIDQDDAFKLAFATLAEAQGEPLLAGLVLASRQDLAPLGGLWQRQDAQTQAWISDLLSSTNIEVAQQNQPIVKGFNAQIRFDIRRAQYLMPETAFLEIVLAHSGALEGGGAAARRYLDAVAAGQSALTQDMEAAWVFMYHALVSEIGAAPARQALRGASVSKRHRHFAGTMMETLNWMISKAALAGYMRGETDALPPRPNGLEPDFNWEIWPELAQRLRGETLAEMSEAEVLIAVELLYLRGDTPRALVLAAQLPLVQKLMIYQDFMRRLDVGCSAYTRFKGQAVFLGGRTLYRFAQAAE